MGIIIQPGDPGAVGNGMWWLTPSKVLNIRNATNTGWVLICTGATPADFIVPTVGGDMSMTATITAQCDTDATSDPLNYMTLYGGAVYSILWTAVHPPTSLQLKAEISPGSPFPTRADMGSAFDGSAILTATRIWTVDVLPATVQVLAGIHMNPCSGGGQDNSGTTLTAQITWLSGPDPRYDTLNVCVAP
jgi:hypothetical protein